MELAGSKRRTISNGSRAIFGIPQEIWSNSASFEPLQLGTYISGFFKVLGSGDDRSGGDCRLGPSVVPKDPSSPMVKTGQGLAGAITTASASE